MATPLQTRANMRLLWTALGVPADFRSGSYRQGPSYVIEAYYQSAGRIERDIEGWLSAGNLKLEGYLTRYHELGEGEGWLDAGTLWTWTEGGLRPPAMGPGAECRGFLGNLSLLPSRGDGEEGNVRIVEMGSPYGIGGIGEKVRAKLGDWFTAGFGGLL